MGPTSAPALCWRRRQSGRSSRGRAEGWRSNRRAARDRSCRGGASKLRWALTPLGICGAAHAFLFDRIENSSRKVEMCCVVLHNSSESWYVRLFAINISDFGDGEGGHCSHRSPLVNAK